MNETCDRCGPAYPAIYRATLNLAELYFCLACTSYHWHALTGQGWTLWPHASPAPQAAA